MKSEKILTTPRKGKASVRKTIYFTEEEWEWIMEDSIKRGVPYTYVVREGVWLKMKEAKKE